MPLPEDVCERVPGTVFRDGDPTTLYWIKDGKICYRRELMRGVDVESFRFYLGHFAKDKKHCYCAGSRLAGGKGATFRALNFTYATDGQSVWTLGGKVNEADPETFVVCDDGILRYDDGGRVPYGYAKDKEHVFYYSFEGKPNIVRRASARSFLSVDNGAYGRDENFIFFGGSILSKADVATWRLLGGRYSMDDMRLFFGNDQVRGADLESFEIIPTSRAMFSLAKDKSRHYFGEKVIDEAQFNELVAQAR